MAKPKAPKKSKVVEVQEDGREIYGFDQDEKLPDQGKPNSKSMSDDIKKHPKFDKFKKGND